MRPTTRRAGWLAATALAPLALLPVPGRAQSDSTQIGTIERQIEALQAELHHVKAQLAARSHEIEAAREAAAQAREAAAVARAAQTSPAANSGMAAALEQTPAGYALVRTEGPNGPLFERVQVEPPGPPLPQGTFRVGDVTVQLGGFIELAGIYRSRNETADILSNFNTGIPLRNNPNYHQPEFRESARQSRASALVTANPDAVTMLRAYMEIDFLAGAPTANSNESNSYSPRIRHAFLTYDRSDWGFEALAGQTWSLMTLSKAGIEPFKEAIPLTIDAQYVPGFTWTREPQLRLVKSFDNRQLWFALSAENPQTVYYTGPNGLVPSTVGSVTITNPGGSGFPPTTNYSDNVAPDIQAKIAYDPAFGSFQAYGIASVEHDRVSLPGTGFNNTAIVGGAGAGAYIHLIPKLLDFRVSGLAGQGIGRFGSAQLPDAVVGPNGQPKPLPEWLALIGLEAHPSADLDLYGYLGTEQESARYFAADVKGKLKGFGYGSPLYSNETCNIELGAAADCVGNTSGITQGTVGAWYKFEHGPYGMMEVGAQYSYTYRAVFQGLGPTPHTDDNMVLFSFRYYPFQK